MALKVANLAQHEILPVKKFIQLMREPRTDNRVHILTISIDNGCVEFSVAAPRGRVIIEKVDVDIAIENN